MTLYHCQNVLSLMCYWLPAVYDRNMEWPDFIMFGQISLEETSILSCFVMCSLLIATRFVCSSVMAQFPFCRCYSIWGCCCFFQTISIFYPEYQSSSLFSRWVISVNGIISCMSMLSTFSLPWPWIHMSNSGDLGIAIRGILDSYIDRR